jgi:acyl-homoserine lactone synthase
MLKAMPPKQFAEIDLENPMIHVVTAENEHQYREEMEQAYRLRHQVFVEEMGWKELEKPDGREIDQFDTKHAVHMLHIDHGEVIGYQRMLPSTGPHLLSEIMPQLCDGERPKGSHIWELTRHCVSRHHREKRGRLASESATVLLSGMVEWGLLHGVSTVIVEIEPTTLLRLVQLHFRPLPLGLPMRIDGRDVLAATLTFDGRTLERLREMRGSRRKVLVDSFARPALLHA